MTRLWRVAKGRGTLIGCGPFESGDSYYLDESARKAGFGIENTAYYSYHAQFPGPYGDLCYSNSCADADDWPCAVQSWPMLKAWFPDCMVPVLVKLGYELLAIDAEEYYNGKHQAVFNPKKAQVQRLPINLLLEQEEPKCPVQLASSVSCLNPSESLSKAA